MANNKTVTIEKSRKLVVVGDGMTGKTCLLHAFKDDRYDPSHGPTIFDTYTSIVQVNNKTINLSLFDTAGEEDFDRLRPLSYNCTDIVLICFSVDYPSSVLNVSKKWTPEIRHFCGQCPMILVACKIDLRMDPQIIAELEARGEKLVTSEVGRDIAKQIKAVAYMECSSKTREGVQELFLLAALLSLENRSNHKKSFRCILL